MQGNDSVSSVASFIRHGEGAYGAVLGARRRAGARWRRLVTAVSAFALTVGGAVALPVIAASPAQAATTYAITVKVVSARTEDHVPNGTGGWTTVTKGAAVSNFRYMINLDNSAKGVSPTLPSDGTECSPSSTSYPAGCDWPSILQDPGAAPIYRQGTSADFAGGGTVTLPETSEDYLVTVLADGYKIDGLHFSTPLVVGTSAGPAELVVEVQPDPLPDATLRAQVFLDEASTNGAIDNGEQGLANFQGHINDTLGEITTDVYGNPLCTVYAGEDPVTHVIPWDSTYRNEDGTPKTIATIGGKCLSDSTGMLTIPHVGTNRYTTTVTPPDGTDYVQTTTLEGNHDFDTWLMENATGYDTEATVGGEPVPTPQFGFVHPHDDLAAGTGSITGTVVAVKQYYPPVGGSFNYLNGSTGARLDKPIENPVLSLNDLGNGDQAVWVGRGDAQGHFTIPSVPAGDYQLTWWDEPQNYILQLVNVTVGANEAVDLKQLPMNGWWTQLSGHVFLDTNKNGKRDAGEQGVAQFPLTLRKKDNSLMDRGSNAVTTDSTGAYSFDGAYPLSEWLIMEAYSDNFSTTGVTYQADNQPTPTTVLGAGVDVSVLPIIGLSGTIDWGVQKYVATAGENGGIVGSVSYDTTRNELDPRYAVSEDWQPGVPNIPVKLYATIDCPPDGSEPCDSTGRYVVDTDGSVKKGKALNSYLSEHWSPPTGCTARDVDGNPLRHGIDEDVLATNQDTDGECIAALAQGVQFGTYATDQGTPDANFGATVDGNYGFGDVCPEPGVLDATDPANPTCKDGAGNDVAFTPITNGSYLVSLDIPDDASGNPTYQVTSEEDINIARGDTVVPQAPPPSCAGPLHTVDVKGDGTDGYPSQDLGQGVTVPASTPVDNPPILDIGGSPYEGMAEPRCGTKLVDLNNGKSIVPMFNIFTDVPIPSRLRGLIVDDLNFSVDLRTVLLGDKAGVPHAPVGIYDYTGRLVYTAESDFNGYYDVLMPSTDHISCPTPSGVCTNVYRFVGNDPGAPGHLNQNFNPRFRTIATEFEAMPGVTIPTDLAPTQVGVSVGIPGTSPTTVQCLVDQATPQLFRVDRPFMPADDAARDIHLTGYGFGATPGSVRLGATVLTVPPDGWSDTSITATIPPSSGTGGVAPGPYQLTVTAANGRETVSGLTFHVFGGNGNNAYPGHLYEVGPGVTDPAFDPTAAASQTGTPGVSHAIQNALDAAAKSSGSDLVVVYPNTPTAGNPRGAYYENLVITSPVKLQGVGAGGFQGPNNSSPYVQGTVLDGAGFAGDSGMATDWLTRVDATAWLGDAPVSDGAVISLFAPSEDTFSASASATSTPAIDGIDIRGGDQQGVPGNLNDLTGGLANLPPNISTQGGAVYAHAWVANLQVTNNVVENNGGSYGTIRIGTPDVPAPNSGQHNPGVRIANNRIVQNAGTNLAGAIGLFAGADGYEVSGNDICGNFSLEYGAGVSVYGRSPNGSIHHNRIILNNSNDEGAGIMIAGQLPADPDLLSEGSGPVDIYANRIQGNLANDDGGGIRFLQAGNFPMNVHDNVIAGNISTHEGGGIGINDAPDVRIYNNTIMDNITTATAVTSNGQPAPAGVSTSANSSQLQATLPSGAPSFSNPLMFDNILWDNRAGTRAGTTVTGVGVAGDTSPLDYWDVGVADGTGQLAPVNSVIQQDPTGPHPFTVQPNAGNSAADPQVKETWVPSVAFATWRQNPAFVDATLVSPTAAGELVPEKMGNYHLTGCPTSPACDLGAQARGGVNASSADIDGDARPSGTGWDAGADEVVQAAPPPPPEPTAAFVFSTAGNSNPPNVPGTADDSDVYAWDGTGYARSHDLTAAPYGVPASANVDGLAEVSDTQFYLSFADDVTLPGIGAVQDEDVVYWDGTAWSVPFDLTGHGMTSNQLDVNAIGVRDGILYFATAGSKLPPGVGGKADDSDVYSWDGTAFARVLDASDYGVPNNARVDGAVRVDATHYYLSFTTNTSLPGIGGVDDEDIVALDTSLPATQRWSTWFNGTAHGLTTNDLDIDAFSLRHGATAPATVTP